MSLPVPVAVAVSAAVVGCIAVVAVSLVRQFRLRRHLKRLRTVPLERFGRS
ncbi:MAG TPA: hypothetical protein VKE40_19040 [Gemmataceae bacterium]|nr:hypothetical protein [Gemmataceae bacterium]